MMRNAKKLKSTFLQELSVTITCKSLPTIIVLKKNL